MAEPNRPTQVGIPQKQPQLKSGQEHIFYGCLMFGAGTAAIGGIMYTFRDFFISYPWTALIGLYVVWRVYYEITNRVKKRKEK